MLKKSWKELKKLNFKDKVLLLPTDTIYGFHARVGDQSAIDRIQAIKQRQDEKPLINLIARLKDLEDFDIELTKNQKKFLRRAWPGRVTVIITNKKKERISFRIPAHWRLRGIIRKHGPLVSTSANISGQPNITEPDKLSYALQQRVDFCVDVGKKKSKPSTIVEILR